MGYARIKLDVEPHGGYPRCKGTDRAVKELERQLAKDGLPFIEDYDSETVVIRWGNDLTAEELQEMENDQ